MKSHTANGIHVGAYYDMYTVPAWVGAYRLAGLGSVARALMMLCGCCMGAWSLSSTWPSPE